MQVGDIVMFSDEKGTYAKYFYGAIGTITSIGNSHCSVKWRPPGPLYFGRRTTKSSLEMSRFTVLVRGHQ